jgi:hypothetical protein
MWNDCILTPHGYFRGRRIWMHPEQYRWYNSLQKEFLNAEVDEHIALWGEFSEWIEQQAEDWEQRSAIDTSLDDGLGPHFALSVAAGGWRSAALVLVNDQLVEAITASCKTAAGKDIWEDDPVLQTTIEEFRQGLSSNPPALQLSTWKRPPPLFNVEEVPGLPGADSVFGISEWRRT